MSLEQDIQGIKEDMFKPATPAEINQRLKDAPFTIADWAEKHDSAIDVYGSPKLRNKIEELAKKEARFMVLAFDQDEMEKSEIKQEIEDCKADGYTFLHYEDNYSSGEAILYKLPISIPEASMFKPADKEEIVNRQAELLKNLATPEVRDAIEKVVDYLYDDELKSWEEGHEEGETPGSSEDHILYSLNVLAKAIGQR
jgi:hypothetical protein